MSKRRRTDKGAPAPFVNPPLPKNPRQDAFLRALWRSGKVVATGPAGTGKTFLSAAAAAWLMHRGDISKIYLTRPNIPAARSLGFFPGSLDDKMAPWLRPITRVLRNSLGDASVDIAMRKGYIEATPFEVMRGLDAQDAFVLLDEAQNTTPEEMQMFLTRIGENSFVVVNGDVSQSDLKGSSGLATLIGIIQRKRLNMEHVEFLYDDILRSDFCREVVRAFAEEAA